MFVNVLIQETVIFNDVALQRLDWGKFAMDGRQWLFAMDGRHLSGVTTLVLFCVFSGADYQDVNNSHSLT